MWSKALELMLKTALRRGSLSVTCPGGQRFEFGDGSGPPVSVRIDDRPTLRRLVLFPELALGEAYMDGTLTIEGDDLHGFLSVILQNYDNAPRLWWQRWHIGLRARLRRLALQ